MKRIGTLLFVLVLLMLVVPFQSWGQISTGAIQPKKFEVMVGKSLTLTSTAAIKRASVVSPEIADVVVISQTQVYLTGKAPGTTSLTFWGLDDRVFAIANIEVTADLAKLGDLVAQLLPEEKGVKITSVHNNIAITGTVTSTSALSQIVDMAHSYSGKDGKVVNLAEVSGVQQVMVEVRVAEISHSLLRKMGVNWAYFSSSGKIGINTLGGLTNFNQLSVPTTSADINVSQAINYLFTFASKGTPWVVFIDALKEAGLVKVLASPTLITLSGKPANFLAGGEIPIPVPQSTGLGTNTITIEYKPFGVGLTFTPIVLNSKKINIQVAPEVSEPDFTNALTLSGFTVPSFATRRLSTNIELDDGQSFVIAGLLRDDTRKIVSKFPLLGDIPIIGAVFRSTSWQRNETELVVIATPRLVKPTDMAKQPLPTDKYSDPNDFEFYLKGKSEGTGTEPTKPIK